MAKRGRPSKEPTPEQRAKVIDMLAKKVAIMDCAAMLGMTHPTFKKFFQNEILSSKKITGTSRPSREVKEEHRTKVSFLLGCGMEPEDVALVLRYVGDGEFENFQTDFAFELRVGKADTRAQFLERVDKQSQGGLIGATAKLEALSRAATSKPTAPSAPAEYIGKKNAAAAAASTVAAAGGKFAPRTPPRLVANGGQRVDPKPKG